VAEAVTTEQQHTRNWQSVRTLIESMVFLGVLYLASATKASSDTNIELKTQMVTMTEEVRSLRTQLDNVQALARDIAKTEVRLEDMERRTSSLEASHNREALRQAK
jgi:hypothetical protein